MDQQTDKRLRQIYDKFSNSKKSVHKAYIESIRSLVNLAELKDPYTKRHSVKVSTYAVALAKLLRMPNRDIRNLRLAAILHDIGKVVIRQEVLLKPSALTSEEFEEVKKHAEIGAEMLKPLKFSDEVMLAVRHHHENYDGTGYPYGLKKEDIPFMARVLAVVDVYEALTSERAYRTAYSQKAALEIMKTESGKRFDPGMLDIFITYAKSKQKRAGYNGNHKNQARGQGVSL